MRKEDFYTGEPVPNGSPPIVSVEEIEAANNASFGKYDYDPGMRVMSQPVSIYPGAYGYNTNPNPTNSTFNSFMNPPVGLGANPCMYNNYGGNPAFYYQQQQQYQYQQPQQISYRIEPVNLSGSEFLPNVNFEEEIERLKTEYWLKEIDQNAKDSVNRQNSGYYNCGYFGNNYYGTPYFNPYQYNSINTEVSRVIDKMKEQARQNRINLNMHLSKLSHNVCKHEYDENDLRERYEGKVVQVETGITYGDVYQYNRFNNMVPFDNSQMYREHSEAVSKEFNKVISKDSDMKDCFDNMGVMWAQYQLEEEKHRRRNGSVLYNSEDNSYKYFVRKKAEERYAAKNGLPYGGNTMYGNLTPSMMQQQFPTLSQSVKLADDGTLNVTCNFGSRAGQTYSVHNSQEAEYDKDRERFNSFINSIPGSIYLNGGDNNGKS